MVGHQVVDVLPAVEALVHKVVHPANVEHIDGIDKIMRVETSLMLPGVRWN
jgi:hypothetical protein